MQVITFGGASVNNAAEIRKFANTIKNQTDKQILIAVLAIGKTTFALEKLARAYAEQATNVHELFEDIKQYHYHIINELFGDGDQVYIELNNTFVEIDWMLEDEPHDDFDFIYDQIVSIGELAASRIVSAYLNHFGVNSTWLDVRGYILTDNTYRAGAVDLQKSCASIHLEMPPLLQKSVVVTQAFLGGTSENFTTTLGHKGADYTATIFADCLGVTAIPAN